MKGDSSTHIYTEKGRENHERIFGKRQGSLGEYVRDIYPDLYKAVDGDSIPQDCSIFEAGEIMAERIGFPGTINPSESVDATLRAMNRHIAGRVPGC